MNEEHQHENNQELMTVESTPPQGLDIIERAQIDMQIATARKYPRSIKKFIQTAEGLATLNEEVAESCFYVLPRAGKKIEGPGIRLAEIVGSAWGNLRYGTRIVGESEDRRRIIAEGIAHDLENNTLACVRIERRITDRLGKRYNDDMIAVTANAAASIALRNAIFKVVPFAYVQPIYLKAKALAIGDVKSLVERRQKQLDYFTKIGVSIERVLLRVGKKSVEDIGLSEMETLFGLGTAIKDGDVDLETAFPAAMVAADDDNAPKSLSEKVKNAAPKAPEVK